MMTSEKGGVLKVGFHGAWAGNVVVDGVDPGRDEWKAWCSLRDGAAQQYCPDRLTPVAFVVNKVLHWQALAV